MKYRYVLVRPRNPLNIGAAARAVANFGFSDLVIVDPYAPVLRDAKTAVGAESILKKAKVVKTVQAALKDCTRVIGTSCGKKRTTGPVWIGPDDLGAAVQKTTRVAILFGSEKNGLSNDELNYCQWILKIPTSTFQPSMNLSHTIAVVAYILSTLNQKQKHHKKIGVDEVRIQDRERLVKNAAAACEHVGFFSTWTSKRTEKELRQAIYKWNLSKKDVAMLHGIFRCLKK